MCQGKTRDEVYSRRDLWKRTRLNYFFTTVKARTKKILPPFVMRFLLWHQHNFYFHFRWTFTLKTCECPFKGSRMRLSSCIGHRYLSFIPHFWRFFPCHRSTVIWVCLFELFRFLASSHGIPIILLVFSHQEIETGSQNTTVEWK